MFLSVLFNSLGANIRDALMDAARTPQWAAAVHDPALMADPVNRAVIESLQHPVAGGVLDRVQDDSSIISQMADVFAHPFKVGFAESMDSVFLLAVGRGCRWRSWSCC